MHFCVRVCCSACVSACQRYSQYPREQSWLIVHLPLQNQATFSNCPLTSLILHVIFKQLKSEAVGSKKKIKETNEKPLRNTNLVASLAATSRPAFKLYHHDGDVVRAATVERLQDDALGAEVGLVKTLADKPHGLLVAEGVPQAIGRQDHELWLQFIQVKGHDVRVGDDYIEVLQWVVPERAGHGQDPLNSPGTIKTDESTCKDTRSVLVTGDADRFCGPVEHMQLFAVC